MAAERAGGLCLGREGMGGGSCLPTSLAGDVGDLPGKCGRGGECCSIGIGTRENVLPPPSSVSIGGESGVKSWVADAR